MNTYTNIPQSLTKGNLLKRQEELLTKLWSLEGHLYSLGAAVTECRKELMKLKEQAHAYRH